MKEINIKIDRIITEGFSMVCHDTALCKTLKDDKITCSDCGRIVDAYIQIVVPSNKTEGKKISQRHICTACYATNKYKKVP